MLTSSALPSALVSTVKILTVASSLVTGETTVTGIGKTIVTSNIAESQSAEYQHLFVNKNVDLDAALLERDVILILSLKTKRREKRET